MGSRSSGECSSVEEAKKKKKVEKKSQSVDYGFPCLPLSGRSLWYVLII